MSAKEILAIDVKAFVKYLPKRERQSAEFIA